MAAIYSQPCGIIKPHLFRAENIRMHCRICIAFEQGVADQSAGTSG
jgi:hypothetical protein